MSKKFYKSALKISASAAALSLVSFSAFAAECFDRDTSDPKAGNATAVIGPAVDVERLNISQAFRPNAGSDMFSGDRVRTGADSHLQLKLCDWSTYTFSPDSESAISEFFDSEGAGRRRVVNFFRGGMRFASGRDTEPGSTEVEIQESGVTMGVRGTNVILVELDGYVYALLEGPVRDNSGLTPKGLVEFWTEGNREAIEARLFRPGFAVRIGPDGISEPFQADADLLRRIYNAFVPVVPEGDGDTFEYAGDALDESGQGAQEGDDYQEYAENKNEEDDDQTEQRPDDEEEEEDIDPPPVMIPVGDILPLDVLEDFAAEQQNPDGHIFVIAPATMDVNNDGIVSTESGIAMFQIEIDWASRTIAPEALASFVKFDFTVTDPDDLTQSDFSAQRPFGPVLEAYFQALLDSSNVPFAGGAGGLASFDTPTYALIIRQGENGTVTVDVSLDYSATDPGQGTGYMISASAEDLILAPGPGDLAYFSTNLGAVLSLAELDFIDRDDVAILTGSSSTVASTLDGGAKLTGTAVAQLEVDFGARTIGGGSSFIAFATATNAATGGQSTAQHVSLDQAVSFDSGLFGLAFHTLTSLSSDANVLYGQTQITNPEGLGGYLASIIADGSGNHIYSEVEAFESFGVAPLTTLAELDAFGPGGFFFYDGTGFSGGDALLIDSAGDFYFGSLEAAIEIDFANRTLGGGISFVTVDIGSAEFDFTEALNEVSFDDALNGFGAFGFDADDFDGTNIDAALFLIRNDPEIGIAGEADLFVNFNDGAGGAGTGAALEMPLASD